MSKIHMVRPETDRTYCGRPATANLRLDRGPQNMSMSKWLRDMAFCVQKGYACLTCYYCWKAEEK